MKLRTKHRNYLRHTIKLASRESCSVHLTIMEYKQYSKIINLCSLIMIFAMPTSNCSFDNIKFENNLFKQIYIGFEFEIENNVDYTGCIASNRT